MKTSHKSQNQASLLPSGEGQDEGQKLRKQSKYIPDPSLRSPQPSRQLRPALHYLLHPCSRPLGRGGVCGSAFQCAQQVDHFNGRHGGLGTLVAGLGPGTLNRLLDGVNGQHAKGNGNIVLQ